ncbi:hypothetical protein [Morganella morganii]|uniref:hypothetical protein n=1 Tax=Morganella morganii TaxID=582 RepID=UPI003315B039
MTDKNYAPYYAKDGSNTAASLRDKFTMAAMQGDLASQDENTGYYENITPDEYLTARDEFYCRIADAMLRAREK